MAESEAHAAAIWTDLREPGPSLTSRPGKSLHKVVTQDHRVGKRVTRRRWGGKSFDAAHSTRIGSALLQMSRKRQMAGDTVEGLTAAEPFYALAA